MELHHIVTQADGGTDDYDNCIPLCFDCHADVGNYNPAHPKGHRYTPPELRAHRDKWYAQVCELNTQAVAKPEPAPTPGHVVTGDNNLVAGRDVNITTQKLTRKNVVQYDPGGRHITNQTARKIRALVKEYVDMAKTADRNPAKAAQEIWGSLYRKFDVTSYKEIGIEDSDAAVVFLQSQLAQARPSIRRKDPDKWRMTFLKPIWARAREIGMSHDEVHQFATIRLQLPKPLLSLNDLTQRDLQKFHRIMISEAKKKASGGTAPQAPCDPITSPSQPTADGP